MEDTVPLAVKKRRLQEIIHLQQQHSLHRAKEQVGQIQEVLIEGTSKKSDLHWKGRNTQNTVVVFPKEHFKMGDFVHVKIENCTSTTLLGTAINYSDNN
jgi:tRNA-2-methylthio-N6-dimethylallyladenosine synthase